jgi:putative ATP-binding cassette transporter
MLALLFAVKAAAIVACIQQNHWYNSFYSAIQSRELPAFWSQVALFCGIAVTLVTAQVASSWIASCLKTRWRSFAVEHYTTDWLKDRAYYRLRLGGKGSANPDQRIAEDAGNFVDRTLDLGVGFLDVSVSLVAFTSILWSLSGSMPIAGLALPGYMVFGAFAYSLASTWITHRLGSPLAALYGRRSTLEADFRFGLVRLVENAETVAFYRGEAQESAQLSRRWSAVMDNLWTTLRRERRLGLFTHSYGQFSILVPFLLAAPRYFGGAISFGEVMQVVAAFASVVACLDYLIQNYRQIAQWQAEVERLKAFQSDLEASRTPRTGVVIERGEQLAVSKLDLTLPSDKPLLSLDRFELEPGGSVLIKGPSGTGKSTLLRAVAGLWPYASGRVSMTAGSIFFVPQRPYLPLGTLREAIHYPAAPGTDDAETCRILETVGLGHLAGHLDAEDLHLNLSGGEQQRIAFARILLAKPATIFLDEATSALDEPTERKLYRMLRDAAWKPTIVSIGHRSTLEAYHDRILELQRAA